MSGADAAATTTGRRIFYHSVLNLLGTGSPLLVAVVAIPLLIAGLGTERFGILTLVWVLIGYLSLLDLGIGRALTKLVAERLGRPSQRDVAPLIGTALLLMFAFGALGAVLVGTAAAWFAGSVLDLRGELQREATTAFLLVAVTLPVVTATSALRGVLEAHQRFDMVNAVRVPMGVFTFAGPLLVLPFTTALPAIVAVLLAGRVAAAFAHWQLVRRVVADLPRTLGWRRRAVRPLLRLGGWMTVSNAVSPLMVYLDRFLIGALLGATAVAYYATPYEVVTRLWIIPGALLSVLFPAFSAGMSQRPAAMASLFGRAMLAVFLVIAPLTLIIVTFGEAGLALWVGEEFARNSTNVLQWLAVGVLINSLAQVPFTVLQGAGRPDLTAKLHLCEVPLYLAAVAWLTLRYGIEGAAIAWVLRVALDTVALFAMSAYLLPGTLLWIRRAATALPIALVLIGVGALLPSPSVKVPYVAVVLLVGLAAGWLLLGLNRSNLQPPADAAPGPAAR